MEIITNTPPTPDVYGSKLGPYSGRLVVATAGLCTYLINNKVKVTFYVPLNSQGLYWDRLGPRWQSGNTLASHL